MSDTARHRILQIAEDLNTVLATYGGGEDGEKGYADGTGTTARFNEPQGLALVPAELREKLGYDVLITDTVNHRLRSLNLRTGEVVPLRATACSALLMETMPSQATQTISLRMRPPTAVALSSPWDGGLLA